MRRTSGGSLVVVDLPDPKGQPGPKKRDLPLPPGAVITLITRDDKVLIPKGNTHIPGWDRITVLARVKDQDPVRNALLTPFRQDFSMKPQPYVAGAQIV